VYLYSQHVVSVNVISQRKFDQPVQRVSDQLDVVVGGLDDQVSEGEQPNDEIVELVVLYHEIVEIASRYFIGSIAHLLYFFKLTTVIVFLLQNCQEMLQILLLLLNTQKFFKLLKTCEKLIFSIDVESCTHEKQLERTTAVHTLGLPLEFG
jgi:hypothetical protein